VGARRKRGNADCYVNGLLGGSFIVGSLSACGSPLGCPRRVAKGSLAISIQVALARGVVQLSHADVGCCPIVVSYQDAAMSPVNSG